MELSGLLRVIVLWASVAGVASLRPRPAMAEPPLRLKTALGAPEWLELKLSHRTRFERLSDQFRAGASGSDFGLALRTLLFFGARVKPIVVGLELQDARIHFVDRDTPLDSTLSNPLDILQAHVGLDLEDVFVAGGKGSIRAGRLTLDLGSRRLVARNRYRNTINGFNGVDLGFETPSKDELRLFAVLPVDRRPKTEEGLRSNALELDAERLETQLFGLFVGSRTLGEGFRGEIYVIGFLEADERGVSTSNRRLVNPGMRVLREAGPGRVDFEVEGVLQIGSSRATRSPEDQRDLEHLAAFAHASVGYTLSGPVPTRIVVGYDHATGDADPRDDTNGRFDTLFGARRFEYGPTGLYGLLARSNLRSLVARVELSLAPDMDGFVAYRAAWLAEARDAWTSAGVRDPEGASGTFLGHQIEARARWRLLPGNLSFDLGFAHAALGSFPRRAGGPPPEDPTYLYAQLSITI